MKSKAISKKDNSDDQTSEVLNQTLEAALEGIAGFAAADKQARLLSFGRILQRIRGGRFVAQLKAEWDEYRKSGRIKETHFESEQGRECLQEILDFLDGDSPDQLRFEAMKRVFLKSASTEDQDTNSVLPQQFLRMIRSLTSGEAILLFDVYRNPIQERSAPGWLQATAANSTLQFPELVALHEEGLMKKQLLTQRMHSDFSGTIVNAERGRLTHFGYNLCKYVEADTIESECDENA